MVVAGTEGRGVFSLMKLRQGESAPARVIFERAEIEICCFERLGGRMGMWRTHPEFIFPCRQQQDVLSEGRILSFPMRKSGMDW